MAEESEDEDGQRRLSYARATDHLATKQRDVSCVIISVPVPDRAVIRCALPLDGVSSSLRLCVGRRRRSAGLE